MTRLINEGLVEDDGLTFREYTNVRQLLRVNITGRIHCTSGVTVEVDKWLDVRRTKKGYEVVGFSYSYQAWLQSSEREILRYDTAHGMNGLHYHLFNLKDGQEEIVKIEVSELPSLDGFIRQAIRIVENAKAQAEI